MAITLIGSVQHWKRKLEKDPTDDYIQNTLRKLSKIPMTLEILEETHIGRTIRNLSKRDDVVGEKAKTLLNQWRQMAFSANSKKENVSQDSKSSSKHRPHEKTVHSEKQTSHNHVKSNSVSSSLSEESSKKYVNGNCKINNSTESSRSLYKYDIKERNSKYMDYDPHTETSTGYNPECPELFPSDKPVKTKKPILVESYEPTSVKHETYEPSPVKHETYEPSPVKHETYEPSPVKHKTYEPSPVKHETYEPSTVKRKLTDETEQKEDKSHHKKFKSNSHSNSENIFNSVESKKSPEKKEKHKEKHKEKTKENSHSSSHKKESSKVKLHSESAKKPELASDAKKTNKEVSESDTTKPKKAKVKIHSAEEFTSSEVSFEDCLGFNDIVTLKKNSKSHSSKKPSSSNTPSKEKAIEKIKKDLPKTDQKDQKTKVSKESSSHSSKEKVSKESSSHSSKEKVSKESSSHSKKEKISKHSSSNSNKSKVSKDSHHSHKEVPFIVPKPSTKLDVADITSTLPEIQPNYRPLPRTPDFYAPKKKEVMSNEDAIKFTTSRREKTAVYSGRKNASYYTEVPSLLWIATKVLIENIDAIECVGDASYELMKPVLERCNASQLYDIENYNPKFIEDTNDIWQAHCKKDFKLMTPMEHETWRELYWRAHDEREKKLESVKKHISKSISTSTPVRQVKLAYVDSSYVKPPRDVARRQAKNGTAAAVNHVIKPISSSKPSSPSKPVLKPSAPAPSTSNSSSSSFPHAIKQKPKVAPLMAKTLKSMKAFRRK